MPDRLGHRRGLFRRPWSPAGEEGAESGGRRCAQISVEGEVNLGVFESGVAILLEDAIAEDAIQVDGFMHQDSVAVCRTTKKGAGQRPAPFCSMPCVLAGFASRA